jgi:DNA-binding IclR family transcriptional regulator
MQAGKAMAKPAGEREQNKSTGRVLTVLSAFISQTEDSYGITELSEKLEMTKNMVYRAVSTLVDQGFLVRGATGSRYELGFRILELRNSDAHDPDLRDLCAPSIRAIYELTGETVSLTVRHGDNVVFIDGVETKKPGTWRNQIGDRRPLHAVASSRVVLAYLTDDEVNGYIKRHSPMRMPGGEILTAEELWSAVYEIRRLGYAINRRNVRPRMVSVAFPIRDSRGHVQGAIAVGGPQERFGERALELLPELQNVVAELNNRTQLYPTDFTYFLNDTPGELR